jgi:hypothetical protein
MSDKLFDPQEAMALFSDINYECRNQHQREMLELQLTHLSVELNNHLYTSLQWPLQGVTQRILIYDALLQRPVR